MNWVKERICEPSTWGAVAGILVAAGVLSNLGVFIWLGIASAVAAFILKERANG